MLEITISGARNDIFTRFIRSKRKPAEGTDLTLNLSEFFELVQESGRQGWRPYMAVCAARMLAEQVAAEKGALYGTAPWPGALQYQLRAHSDVVRDVMAERLRQSDKFGKKSEMPPLPFLAILQEEVGEVSKEVVEMTWGGGDPEAYRKELVQVAAVALAMIQTYDFQAASPGGFQAEQYNTNGTRRAPDAAEPAGNLAAYALPTHMDIVPGESATLGTLPHYSTLGCCNNHAAVECDALCSIACSAPASPEHL